VTPGVGNPLRDKTILVTGGTGSFGQVMLRRLRDLGPREIRIFSRDEEKQWATAHSLGIPEIGGRNDTVHFWVGDVRNPRAVDAAMKGVDIVFSAAALKQVPRCEHFVFEAVQTNIIGAQHVIDAAVANGVEKVVMISTDKAAKPINAMGMTKAVQEKIAASAAWRAQGTDTRICCVRYGNVLSSRGSVVPLFQRQITMGKALTVTDPTMTRFLLTLEDAVDLVLFATENTRGGEVFVHEAPAASVATIAEAVALQGGVAPDYNVVGIRPGEKMHEVLVTEEEALRSVRAGGQYFAVLPSLDMPEVHEAYLTAPPIGYREFASDVTRRMEVGDLHRLLERAAPVAA
jgi:UDP-N-acetylglucosamine 4,6-dehydratase/5-epimerase